MCVQVFCGLPALRYLDASYGDFHMHAPSALPLSHLHFSRGATADEACPPSACATALTFLSVAGRVITQPLVAAMAAMAALRYLDVSACQLINEDAPMLAPLSVLRSLHGIRMRHMLARFNYLASGAMGAASVASRYRPSHACIGFMHVKTVDNSEGPLCVKMRETSSRHGWHAVRGEGASGVCAAM